MGNTPNVRFKGFTEDWEQRKLEEVCSEIGDGLHSAPEYDDSGKFFFINGNNLINGHIVINSNETKRVSENTFEKNNKQLDDNTVLLSINGTIGNLAYYQGEPVMLGKSAAYLKANKIDKTFLYSLLQTTAVMNNFMLSLTGTTIKNLGLDAIKKTKISIPELREQERIGLYFSQLDHLITLHQQKCVEIKKLKKYMLQNMFPQKDEKVPKIRFAGFTGDWEQHKLSELTTMHARIGWQNLRTSEFLDSGDYMLITGTDFNDGAIDYSTCHYVEKERYEQDKNIQIRNGSILITKDGTLGKVAYVQGLTMPATLNAGVFNVEIKDENIADEKYLYQYLKAPFLMDYVSKKATGGTIKHLNQSILVDFPIAMPKKEEQVEIGNYFQSLDHLITLHQQKCNALKEFKKYMLQNMFPQKGENKCQH